MIYNLNDAILLMACAMIMAGYGVAMVDLAPTPFREMVGRCIVNIGFVLGIVACFILLSTFLPTSG